MLVSFGDKELKALFRPTILLTIIMELTELQTRFEEIKEKVTQLGRFL